MTDRERQRMKEALGLYRQGSQYQIMATVCPAVSLDQAFMSGWMMARSGEKNKVKRKKK